MNPKHSRALRAIAFAMFTAAEKITETDEVFERCEIALELLKTLHDSATNTERETCFNVILTRTRAMETAPEFVLRLDAVIRELPRG